MDIEKFKKNIQPTLEWLRAGGDNEYKFDMEHFACRSRCGTTCCIAGHVALINEMNVDPMRASMLHREAALRDFLGLTIEEAFNLFYCRPAANDSLSSWNIMAEATPEQAVVVIEHAMETGVIDWEVAL